MRYASDMNDRPVIAIGNFDGVHLGHRAIVEKARSLAQSAPVIAVTFEPHPVSLLRPGSEPLRLTDAQDREWLLLQAGANKVVTLAVDRALLSMQPEAFISWLIETQIGGTPQAFVEGPDFRFGKDRAGDAAVLEKIGQEIGFSASVVSPVQMALIDQTVIPVSSSLVRWLLANGRVLDVARCLGRAHAIESIVVKGEQRGRTIGVPTINLDDAALTGRLLPQDGVYAAFCEVEGDLLDLKAAAVSIGVKPTFSGRKRTVEAHLLDFSGEIYGKRARLHLTRWVREQRTFAGIDELKRQLARDISQVRAARDSDFLDEEKIVRRFGARGAPIPAGRCMEAK